MTIESMEELFTETLRDVYYAEKQILKALPMMVKRAHENQLKQALEQHRQETESQIKRLEQVFEQLHVPARGRKCEAIDGLIDEAKEFMRELEDRVLDAGMIGALQAVEHFEISRYGTLAEWAKELGHREAANLLQQSLAETKKTDKLLTEIAESSINQKAMAPA